MDGVAGRGCGGFVAGGDGRARIILFFGRVFDERGGTALGHGLAVRMVSICNGCRWFYAATGW